MPGGNLYGSKTMQDQSSAHLFSDQVGHRGSIKRSGVRNPTTPKLLSRAEFWDGAPGSGLTEDLDRPELIPSEGPGEASGWKSRVGAEPPHPSAREPLSRLLGDQGSAAAIVPEKRPAPAGAAAAPR